jgi:DNA processing protein
MELEKKLWPDRLKKIRPRLKNLYYKGNIDLLFDTLPKLAVVGSRRMSDYGKRIIEKWVELMAGRGVEIVSGFMYGVDQAAHKTCVDSGGKTIAVLGWGIDRQVAGMDEKLYRKILEGDGLIVSEYPDAVPADRWTFPARNRIVVGLSDVIWVVEGAVSSGSMITARLGREMGKKVLALPGQVGVKVAEGVNSLIKNGKAEMALSVNDLYEALGMEKGQMKMNFGGKNDSKVIALLQSGPRTTDEMVRILNISVTELMAELAYLGLMGMVEESEGKYCAVV